jgi:hypothetical protein
MFTRVNDEAELKLATRLVVAYHDSLRTECEQLSIEAAAHDIADTALLEEACDARNREEELDETGFDDNY